MAMQNASKTTAFIAVALMLAGCRSNLPPPAAAAPQPDMQAVVERVQPQASQQPGQAQAAEEWFRDEMRKQGVTIGEILIEHGLGESRDKSAARVSVQVESEDLSKAAQDVVLATSLLTAAEAIDGIEVRVYDMADRYAGSVYTDRDTVQKFFVDRTLSEKQLQHSLLVDFANFDDGEAEPLLLVLFPEANVLDN